MKKFKLPRIHFPLAKYVELEQLKKLPKDMVLRVKTSALCAYVHVFSAANLSHKSARFHEIYNALEYILFSKLKPTDYEEGVAGIFPIKPDPKSVFCCDECKMCISDIRVFFGNDIPPMSLMLLPEHAQIAYEREKQEELRQSFISLGTAKELADKLSYNDKLCKVFFDKNEDKLVICDADEKPWNN